MVKLKWTGILLCFAGLSLAGLDSTQDESGYSATTSKRYSNYIGVAAGLTSGYGLSYKRWFNKWALQVTVFPWYEEINYSDHEDRDYYDYYDRDSGYSNNGYGSIGLMYIRSLVESKYIRFCAYGGGNCYVDYSKYDYYSNEYRYNGYNNYVLVHHKGKELKNTVSLGAGCGAEFFVWRFGFHGMAGLRGSKRFPDDVKNLSLTADAGVYFRF